jgi:hypothetical protein
MEYMETMKRSLFSGGYLARCEEGDEVGDKDAKRRWPSVQATKLRKARTGCKANRGKGK